MGTMRPKFQKPKPPARFKRSSLSNQDLSKANNTNNNNNANKNTSSINLKKSERLSYNPTVNFRPLTRPRSSQYVHQIQQFNYNDNNDNNNDDDKNTNDNIKSQQSNDKSKINCEETQEIPTISQLYKLIKKDQDQISKLNSIIDSLQEQLNEERSLREDLETRISILEQN
eukprot:TRINITY_DN16652_c0_g1_i1.p1 TRINITY_DN16652_c0_g1~~TRINITY_DN16652_c0_g1_i1.p1  ORF type:complete len:188 (-),score=52.39 TRINITY_DN16652_c0_g1_i1:18-530(-)